MRVERILTADGSWTLRDVDRDVSFRSIHGAAAESDYVFVDGSGIDRRGAGEVWRVLELGFGAGLNFHRTLLRARGSNIRLDYVSIEREPVSPSFIDHDETSNELIRAALAAPGEAVEHPAGRLTIHACDWRDAPPMPGGFDAYYHDPFAPEHDSAAWSEQCFRWSRALIGQDGRLVTYSVAGDVRRALACAGWLPHKRPGLPPKREVLWAEPTG